MDGKSRYDGVRSFLQSRGIDLPQGEPVDPPERETVCDLGNRKNWLFLYYDGTLMVSRPSTQV